MKKSCKSTINQLSAIPEIAEWFDENNKHITSMKILDTGIYFKDYCNGESTFKQSNNAGEVINEVINICGLNINDDESEYLETCLDDNTKVCVIGNTVVFRRYYPDSSIGSSCGSFKCEKYHECSRADIGRNPGKIRGIVMWADYGSGSMSSDGIKETSWYCGPRGDYKMFVSRMNNCTSQKSEKE